MLDVTRRGAIKGGLALCAAAALTRSDLAEAARQSGGLALPDASASAFSASAALPPFESPRQTVRLDPGWRFYFGNADDPQKDLGFGALPHGNGFFAKTGRTVPAADPGYDDSAWSAIDLPHDWAVALPFVEDPNLVVHGSKPLGRKYPETSIGWYRRTFTLEKADAGKRISILFDGLFRHAMVLVNGIYVGRTHSGYPPYSFDITDFVTTGGPNVLLVRVDATLYEGWFYEGAGIYRHVWLIKKDLVHIEEFSPVVRTSRISAGSAAVALECDAKNDSGAEAECGFEVKLLAPDGSVAATAQSETLQIAPGSRSRLRAKLKLFHPLLWDLDHPNLYRVDFKLTANGKIVDGDSTSFGIRSIHFDPDRGVFLNGKNIKIKGTCNHQDHAGVGSALPDRLQYYRVEVLKQMGSNACRTSHNPPTPEWLDACDRLGMLAMVETRMMSSSPEALYQLGKMVSRFRNHPSVFIWSLGNEEPLQGTATGENITSTMKKLVRKLDPTRLCTLAMNGGWGKGASHVVDVQGFNYNLPNIDAFHREFPHQPSIGTEVASAFSDRGVYSNDPARGYISAYDVNKPSWGELAETWWKFYDSRPFLSGAMVWTGFDYRGEPTPYGWPCISSHFGQVDTCGFPKDAFYYYKSWWGNEPVLHLFPHWTWPGGEGQPIDVWVYSNLDSVELFLNGKSLGAKPMKKNSHGAWTVSYAPGVIEARGSKDGKVLLIDRRETTGAAAGVLLHPDRTRIAAGGMDVSVVRVEIVDAKGRMAPTANNMVQFTLDGPGRIIGVGNGDPSSHEPDKASRRSAFNGLSMAIVQSLPQPGTITLKATSTGLKPASAAIETA